MAPNVGRISGIGYSQSMPCDSVQPQINYYYGPSCRGRAADDEGDVCEFSYNQKKETHGFRNFLIGLALLMGGVGVGAFFHKPKLADGTKLNSAFDDVKNFIKESGVWKKIKNFFSKSQETPHP